MKTQEEKRESARKWQDAWRKANPEKFRAQAWRTWETIKLKRLIALEKPANRIENLVRAARTRAKKHGLEFDSALSAVLIATPPESCVCCSVMLDYSTGKDTRNLLQSPSLDRVDNSKGYTVQNVCVICFSCNRKKNNSSIAELETLLAYMKCKRDENG